jgi:predicted DNA-binding transcriptional regulator AlpA
MKILDYEDLKARGIKYSKPHLWRLWRVGKFPKPIKLSATRNAWTEQDIDDWMANLVAQRERAGGGRR